MFAGNKRSGVLHGAVFIILFLITGCSEKSLALWQIRHSPSPEKRVEAVRKLREIADEEAVNALVSALDDKDTRVSIEAMENLSELEVSAINALLGALDSQSVQVRRRALEALSWMYGDEFWVLYENGRKDLLSGKDKYVNQVGESIIRRLCDQDSPIRDSARSLLFHWDWVWEPDSTMVEPLIDAYAFTDSIGWLQGQAITVELMSKINDRRLLPALIDALNSRTFDLGEPATYGLRRIKGIEAVQALGAALHDSSHNYRFQAAQALGFIDDSAAVEVLIEALNSADETTREYAAGALDHVHDLRASAALIRTLNDDSERVRGIAALSLGYRTYRDEKVFNALTNALQDKSSFVRGCAAQALGRFGDLRASDLLIRTLADPAPDARSGAVSGLVELKDLRAVGPLEKVLREDEYSTLRYEAAAALEEITGKEYEVSEEGVKYFPGVCSH